MWEASRIKELTMEKVRAATPRKNTWKMRRFVAAVAVAVLALASTAFAIYVSSFDRLQEIVGEDMAGLLFPLEIGTVIGERTYDGIRIEVVAVGIFGNVIDKYIILEDLTGNRFEGGVTAMPIVSCPNDMSSGVGMGIAAEVIYREANGAVILHSRQYSTRPTHGTELYFFLDEILYNVVWGDGTCEDGIFGRISWDTLHFYWLFPFTLEIDEANEAFLSTENIALGDDLLTSLIVSPFTVSMEINNSHLPAPRIAVHTTNGTISRGRYDLFLASGVHDFTSQQFLWQLPVDFLDLSTVVSVEINGNIIEIP
jgi:hypothetical protein